MTHRSSPLLRLLAPALLLLAAVFVYGTRYWEPQSLFWDENYHVASAQKVADGVMYMEPHPPLGKMLIAVGDALVGGNSARDTSALLGRDHVGNAELPAGYSFAGVRLASVALMILSVLLLYALLLEITANRVLATAFASLLLFDNAMVVHARSAMLEGIQIFFVLLALVTFARIVVRNVEGIGVRHYAMLALPVGLALAVKLNAAVLLLLFVALFAVDQWRNLHDRRWLAILRRAVVAIPVSVLAIAVTFAAVFYVHVVRGSEVNSNRTYKASPAYLEHLRDGSVWTPAGFVVAFRDNLRYMAEYADGVPRLDVCKPGENGSHASSWPLGAKTINYRWNKNVVDGISRVSYTYLVANPIVWFGVLLGIVLSIGLVISRHVYGNAPRDPRLFNWIVLFTTLYTGYLIAILQVDRVMYLYHYLLPLLFGIVNLALVHAYVFADGLRERRWHTTLNLVGIVALVALVFWFFAPLTYGTPLTTEQFELRQWFAFWKLEPIR